MLNRTSQPACLRCGQPATAGNRECLEHAAAEAVALPPRPERRETAPAVLLRSPAWAAAQPYSPDGALWQHQTAGLQHLLRGRNIVVATATASGKSLIFQAWALHSLAADPESATLVFYPTKALANDQLRRWQESCRTMNLPAEKVAVISGDIPVYQRTYLLDQARIVIMTPDVCHAWLLRNTGIYQISRTLTHLSNIIIDEAHVYENVFGSNAAYLFRRLAAAAAAAGNRRAPRIIAATATIQEPAQHLKKLTGQDFEAVGEELNGSPRQERRILHLPLIAQRSRGYPPENQLADLIRNIIEQDPRSQVIAFHDSRQGIERVAKNVDREDVLPYRNGYQAEDRKRIEERLQRNRIRGVISTSALELGIDMPDLNYGINMGLPQTRKQMQQRIGRVGRSRPGTFVILAPEDQFKRHGERLADYIRQSVEPSQLYTGNEYVAYQQALCLKHELTQADISSLAPPDICGWPEQFDAALKNAHGNPPSHLSAIRNRSAGTPPQLAYGLRQSGEERLTIKDQDEENKPIEEITVDNALREAYPGARYHHRTRPYEVGAWKRDRQTGRAYVLAKRARPQKEEHRPLNRRTVTADLSGGRLLGARHTTKPQGSVSSLQLVVTNSVEGFYDGNGTLHEYRTTHKINPNLSRKEKDLPTQGILLQIRQTWFQGEAGEPWVARMQVAQALMEHLAYRRSIARGDLGVAVDNIFVRTPQGYKLSDSAIVVYDNIFGGLDLTGQLWSNMKEYAAQICEAAQTAGHRSGGGNSNNGGGGIHRDNAQRLCKWLEQPDAEEQKPDYGLDPHGKWRVLRPGTKVGAYNAFSEKMEPSEISRPVWSEGVKHAVETVTGHSFLMNEENLDTGGRKDWVLWDPVTNLISELTAGSG